MTQRIAINGFGRIGRNVLRAMLERNVEDLEVVAINDLAPCETNAHLLEFDSVHGPLKQTVTCGEDWLDVGRGKIAMTAERNPADLPWANVDVVLECTGKFRSRAACQAHLDNGSRRVLISAPGKGVDRTIVQGVNQDSLRASDQIVSNASCTTNCLAPLAKVLDDGVGIERGFMTTVHSYTGDQATIDRAHKDLRRARAAALSMVPTSTGAAAATALVLPHLEGKLDGVAIRVPTPDVSCVDLTFQAQRPTDVAEINALIETAARGPMAGILAICNRPLVSIDYTHRPESTIFSADQTRVMGGDMVRVLAWYDNEWGFSNRMIDTARQMAALG